VGRKIAKSSQKIYKVSSVGMVSNLW